MSGELKVDEIKIIIHQGSGLVSYANSCHFISCVIFCCPQWPGASSIQGGYKHCATAADTLLAEYSRGGSLVTAGGWLSPSATRSLVHAASRHVLKTPRCRVKGCISDCPVTETSVV
eukprot:349660-Chlamydomonas_euryale.AAC.4